MVRLLHHLRLRFFPLRRLDPDFGTLLFIFIPNAPERSYWEGAWIFPKTGDLVGIGLDGDETGPFDGSRQFFLSLPDRFDFILAAVRPKLTQVFAEWLQQDLPTDMFSAVKLSGFGFDIANRGTGPDALTDISSGQMTWDVTFETTGNRWLGITIPFAGDEPTEPIVDT